MKVLHEKISKNKYTSFENRKFATMAHARNVIEDTKEYTPIMTEKDKTYFGRGCKSGFFCKDGIYNQFIDLNKNDGKWSNVFTDDKFIESWKDSSKKEEIANWKNSKKGLIIRLFVKTNQAPYYLGYGIYYYVGTSDTGVLWKKMSNN